MPFVSQKQSRQEKMTDFDGANGRFFVKMVDLSQNLRFRAKNRPLYIENG